jgi:hypothetical protein
LEAARLHATLDAPARAADAPQDFSLEIAAPQIALPEALRRAFAAGGAPEPGPMSAEAAFSGVVLMRADLLGGPAQGASDVGAGAILPARVTTVGVDRLALSGLGADASLTGVLALKPDRGPPDGEFVVEIADWAPALAALQEAGALSPEQAAFALRLIDRLGDPEAAPGVFRSRVSLRGREVYANGVRVR